MSVERDLVVRILARDPRAEEEFIQRYRPLILGLARGRFGLDAEGAEEILQSTFACLWQNDHRALRAWRGQGRLSTYLTVIISRLCIGFRKGCSQQDFRHESLSEIREPVAEKPSPVEELTAKEISRAVLEARNDLSARDRLLLTLRFSDGHTPKEIATLVGSTPGTARKAIHDATARLRRKLRGHYPELFQERSKGLFLWKKRGNHP